MSNQRVRLLDEKTINQIAAGEVVENPASVVKELIENALDAGASEITVETRAGGRGWISISDNGKGMSEEDLLLAIERHATSKISVLEDLNSLNSLGFRGEALPSIASISKMRLHTSSHPDKGYVLDVEGGKLGSVSLLPRLRGTTITVRSLFFNVPVRKQFQKSVSRDCSDVHKVLTLFALCYSHVAFTWINDGKHQFSITQDASNLERIAALLGEPFSSSLLPVEHRLGACSLKGYISKPSLHRPNRMGQYLFINQRVVTSAFCSKHILEGYGTRLPQNRFPCFVLHLDLPPHWVDVNVHPQKKEVRLREEQKLTPFLLAAIEEALEKREEIVLPAGVFHQSEEVSYVSESQEEYVIEEKPMQRHEDEVLSFCLPTRKILTKVGRYLLIEEGAQIRMIDVKRAWERVIYEALESPKEVQSLLLPIHLSFAGLEKSRLLEHLDELNQMGISIRHFGQDTFIVDAIPTLLREDEISDVIYAYLEEGTLPKKIGKCLKQVSLSLEMGEMIVEKLFQSKCSEYTPNGQIIHVILDENALAKLLY